MDYKFRYILNNAILRCNDCYTKEDIVRMGFNSIYPFTTENINGYIDNFDLDNKSLLTVGSSSDQVINSAYFNCKNHTVIDICSYTKYYFYLKKAALMVLDYNEFIEYFCYKHTPLVFYNNNCFDVDIFNKLKYLLKEMDVESYTFWNELYSLFSPLVIRKRLFNTDEYKVSILKKINIYLSDEENFNKTKSIIEDINPLFINDDIASAKVDTSFDNIWFSNIGTYHSIFYSKELLDKYNKFLNNNGKILLCYLYDTFNNKKHNSIWNSIYDLDKTYEILNDYIIDYISFDGIKSITNNLSNSKDSVLIYKKKK